MSGENEYAENMKKRVSAVLSSGKRIRYEWDAGGDSTPCYLIEGDQHNLDNDLADYLREQIVYELELPNAEERYHKGSGEVFLAGNGSVFIRFSGLENSYYIDKSLPSSYAYFTRPIEDRWNLRRYLHRCSILIQLTCDWKAGWKLEVLADIEEGDSPAISKEAEEYYTGIMRPYLEPYVARFGPTEAGYLGGKVSIAFRLTETDEANLELEPDYQMVNEYDNKEVILIP